MTFRLLIAVPTHSGAVESVTADTLLGVQKMLAVRGGELEVRFPSAADIATIRNLIAADFLSTRADALLMLDADQGLEPRTALRMIDCERLLVGCFYPRRRFNWSRVSPVESGADLQRILYQAQEFVGALADDGDTSNPAKLENGFARALYVGAGAMLIRRETFSRLAQHYPELAGAGFDAIEFPPPRFAENWGFFNPIASSSEKLAEDYAFCRRWTDCGGEIWADLTANCAHVGRHMFSGNYLDYLAAQRR